MVSLAAHPNATISRAMELARTISGSRLAPGEDSRFVLLLDRLERLVEDLNRPNAFRLKLGRHFSANPGIVNTLSRYHGLGRRFLVVDTIGAGDTDLFEDILPQEAPESGWPVVIDPSLSGQAIQTMAELLGPDLGSIRLIELSGITAHVLRHGARLVSRTVRESKGQFWRFSEYRIDPAQAAEREDSEPGKAITLITSMFNGQEYLRSYLENLIQGELFGRMQVFIFDVGTSSDDLEFLMPYLARFPNIAYFRLSADPGLYDIWNLGIHLSNTPYIGNANLDDRRHPLQLSLLKQALDGDESLFVTSTHVVPVDDYTLATFCENDGIGDPYFSWMSGPYGTQQMFVEGEDGLPRSQCIPHCMPLWRKALHERCGYFNESKYGSAADFELWLRAMSEGLSFSIVPGAATFYYVNPDSYMRVDPEHERIVQSLHETYLLEEDQPAPAHVPDFAALRQLVSFRIN